MGSPKLSIARPGDTRMKAIVLDGVYLSAFSSLQFKIKEPTNTTLTF